MKKLFAFLLLSALSLALFSCSTNPPIQGNITEAAVTESHSETDTQPPDDLKPTSDEELIEYMILKWQQNRVADLYDYADEVLTSLMSRDNFAYIFESISATGGELNECVNKTSTVSEQTVTYRLTLDFDNISAEVSVSIKNMKICAVTKCIDFKNEFEINRGNGITERYFVLENDACRLNAVYTYVNDGNAHPAVLLIGGSGPCDYNETVGILTPFEDIAMGLAENGINSLRIDKRTLGNISAFTERSGINEEYLSDCNAAIGYLKAQNNKGIYLFGHSLGGQIATELAAENSGLDGLIIFNGSARHLADIACDQYIRLDPHNASAYRAYADAAKAAGPETAKGLYYYSASDYYWASYNSIDTAKNITDAGIGTLIINSRNDKQSFDADIELWQTLFGDADNISIHVYDDISHFGYRIDTSDISSLYRLSDFPSDLISVFSDFIKGKQ